MACADCDPKGRIKELEAELEREKAKNRCHCHCYWPVTTWPSTYTSGKPIWATTITSSGAHSYTVS